MDVGNADALNAILEMGEQSFGYTCLFCFSLVKENFSFNLKLTL